MAWGPLNRIIRRKPPAGLTFGRDSLLSHGPNQKLVRGPAYSKNFQSMVEKPGALYAERNKIPSPRYQSLSQAPHSPVLPQARGIARNSNIQVRQHSAQFGAAVRTLGEAIPDANFRRFTMQHLEENVSKHGEITSFKEIPTGGTFTPGGYLELKFADGKKMTINPMSKKIYVE